MKYWRNISVNSKLISIAISPHAELRKLSELIQRVAKHVSQILRGEYFILTVDDDDSKDYFLQEAGNKYYLQLFKDWIPSEVRIQALLKQIDDHLEVNKPKMVPPKTKKTTDLITPKKVKTTLIGIGDGISLQLFSPENDSFQESLEPQKF